MRTTAYRDGTERPVSSRLLARARIRPPVYRSRRMRNLPTPERQAVRGGRRASAPLWAALIARVNVARAAAGKGKVGYLTPLLYQPNNNTSGKPLGAIACNDITAIISAAGGYRAGIAYDALTGWGTHWETSLLSCCHNMAYQPRRCRRPIKMSPVCQLDGVTGPQPTVVAAVAVPQNDEVRNGVRVGLLQASSRDDHGALCRYRCLIGKRDHLRC